MCVNVMKDSRITSGFWNWGWKMGTCKIGIFLNLNWCGKIICANKHNTLQLKWPFNNFCPSESPLSTYPNLQMSDARSLQFTISVTQYSSSAANRSYTSSLASFITVQTRQFASIWTDCSCLLTNGNGKKTWHRATVTALLTSVTDRSRTAYRDVLL
jgi:hypothetical protein